jgi:hypothetical protein
LPFSIRSPYKNPVCTSPVSHRAHLIFLYLITRVIFGEQYSSFSFLCSLLQSPVTLSLLGSNIFLSTLFSNILNLFFTLSVRDQVSHPYKTTGKTTILVRLCSC